MTREEENELVRRSAGGDTQAFEALVTANEKNVYNLALRTLGSREDAEDAAQEVFMKAYAGIAGFRSESSFSVWLYQITNNVCIDMLRRRRKTVSLSRETEDGEAELDLPDERFDPVALTERREVRELVGDALRQLPDDARQIFLLREVAGQSYAEIAETLQIDVGTVKSRIFRARKRICVLLSGNISGEASSERSEGGVQI